MVVEKYNLKWKLFKANQDFTLKEIFIKNNYKADVTLVSDDKIVFPVHKFVLGASSPVLKKLLVTNPHPHPMIFMKGIESIELNSILQFIYLGKTQVFQSRMQNFLELFGRELQIKQIVNDELSSRKAFPDDDHSETC